MTDSDAMLIEDLVSKSFPLGSNIRPDGIHELISGLSLAEMPEVEQEMNAALREAFANDARLHFIASGWEVSVKDRLVQGSISAALIWGILAATGIASPIAFAAVPAVIPLLIDVKRVRLSLRENEVVTRILLANGVTTGSAQELYDQLPTDIQEQLNYLDFLDFLEALVKAGAASETEAGAYEVHLAGDRKFRVSFK